VRISDCVSMVKRADAAEKVENRRTPKFALHATSAGVEVRPDSLAARMGIG
jgi:hypothetical protein